MERLNYSYTKKIEGRSLTLKPYLNKNLKGDGENLPLYYRLSFKGGNTEFRSFMYMEYYSYEEFQEMISNEWVKSEMELIINEFIKELNEGNDLLYNSSFKEHFKKYRLYKIHDIYVKMGELIYQLEFEYQQSKKDIHQRVNKMIDI